MLSYADMTGKPGLVNGNDQGKGIEGIQEATERERESKPRRNDDFYFQIRLIAC